MKRKIILLVGLIIVVLSCFSGCECEKIEKPKTVMNTYPAQGKLKVIKDMGPAQGKSLEVTVNDFRLVNSVKVGTIDDYPAGKDIMYMVISLTLKNISTETIMIGAGELIVYYNDKEYIFDTPELMVSKGWYICCTNINPLISVRRNLVYKLPQEIEGPVFYKPYGEDLFFELGFIKHPEDV